jgi:hypothetical protein
LTNTTKFTNRFNELLSKYPISNYDWDIGDSVYSLEYYICNITKRYNDGSFIRYAGILDYFVRFSDRDDDAYKFDRNRDPWNRQFKVYKSNNKTRYMGPYRCELITTDDIKGAKIYIITTTVEGESIFCLDVITG